MCVNVGDVFDSLGGEFAVAKSEVRELEALSREVRDSAVADLVGACVEGQLLRLSWASKGRFAAVSQAVTPLSVSRLLAKCSRASCGKDHSAKPSATLSSSRQPCRSSSVRFGKRMRAAKAE